MATTEQQSPPNQSPRDIRRQGKADVAAAKARVKADRPFWKKPWVWVVAVIAIAVVSMTMGGGDSGETAGDGDAPEATSAGIGDAVADGKFTFTVSSFDCGAEKLGKGFLAEKAQGQFCVANMSVENTGDEAQLLDAGSMYAYAGDKKYSADTGVSLSVKEGQSFFLEEINPGNTVTGIVAFDVPLDVVPDQLELHDSPFSGGVMVEL